MTIFSKKAALLMIGAAALFSTAANAQRGNDQRGGNQARGNGSNNNHAAQARPQQQVQRSTTVQRSRTVNHNYNRPGGNRNVTRNVNRNVTVNRGGNRVGNNNYRRPVYSASNPSWRYANRPRRNTVITTVPSTYRTINYGGFGYRYNNGIFYRPYNNQFMVIAPPIGIHINILPIGYSRIYVHDHPYYYYNGTYYDNIDNGTDYSVVSPPVGAVVESIPDGFETVVIDGETYYTVDGAQYKPVVQDNGEIWYEVIKAN